MSRLTCSIATVLLTAVFGGLVIGEVNSQTAQRGAPRPDGDDRLSPAGEPGTKTAREEYISPEIAHLALFIGPWRVSEEHFNARGEVVATVKGTEEITWILDRHAIRRVYQSGSGPTIYHAIGTLTWNDVDKKYHGVWFDNVSSAGPTTVTGEWNDEALMMVFTIESFAKDGSVVRHKVVERFINEERRVATTYLIKGTEVVKRIEVRYKRSIPCPARIRPIFDDSVGRNRG